MPVPESIRHIEQDVKQRCDEAWNYVFPVRNQEYVVLSICESENCVETDQTDQMVQQDQTKINVTPAIKIFGMYKTLEEANTASSTISKENDFFNVYVADANAWIPIPPSREFIENVEYQDEHMKGIKESFEKIKERNANQITQSIKRNKANTKNKNSMNDVINDDVVNKKIQSTKSEVENKA